MKLKKPRFYARYRRISVTLGSVKAERNPKHLKQPSPLNLPFDGDGASFQIDFVTNDDKGKVFRITRGSLDQEFVTPRIQRLQDKGRRAGHLVNK